MWPGAWQRDPCAELSCNAIGRPAATPRPSLLFPTRRHASAPSLRALDHACSVGRSPLLLGGGAAQWGDAAGGAFDVDTWVGTAAVAERLWVGRRQEGGAPPPATVSRFAVQMCRMRMRGFSVAPYAGTRP
jgi:hypothetical protein